MKSRSCAAAVLWLGLAHTCVVAPAAAAGADTRDDSRMWMTVGERRFSITLADNDAARAFTARLPLTLDMPDLNGNEKHVKLARPLPADASAPGTIHNGDVMLWGSETLVVFYLTFRSPYAYTRIGRVDDPASLPQVLGRGEARISFTRK